MNDGDDLKEVLMRSRRMVLGGFKLRFFPQGIDCLSTSCPGFHDLTYVRPNISDACYLLVPLALPTFHTQEDLLHEGCFCTSPC